MWRFTAVTILTALFGVTSLSIQTTQVHACSGFIDIFIAEADLIVEGQFVGYTAEVHPPVPDSPLGDIQSVTETITLLPSRFYKGSITTESITIIHGAFTE